MPQPSKLTPIIIGTAVMTFISVFPLLNIINLACCAGIIIGGFAGSAFYAKQLAKTGGIIQFKDGAAIGLLSGLMTAILVAIFNVILTMLTSENPIPVLYRIIDEMRLTIPPEVESFLRKISDEYSKSGFSITLTVINLISNLILYPLFGFVGGIIGASVFGRKRNV